MVVYFTFPGDVRFSVFFLSSDCFSQPFQLFFISLVIFVICLFALFFNFFFLAWQSLIKNVYIVVVRRSLIYGNA